MFLRFDPEVKCVQRKRIEGKTGNCHDENRVPVNEESCLVYHRMRFVDHVNNKSPKSSDQSSNLLGPIPFKK